MKRFLALVGALTILYSYNLLASERKLVNGAGTLSSGMWAVSLDLGVNYPEPLLWGFRVDRGFGDRIQLGISGSSLIILNTFAINGLFNVLKTKNDSDFLSIYLSPSVLHLADIVVDDEEDDIGHIAAFLLQPGLAYEHRFGEERNTGLFMKTGTIHIIGVTTKGGLWLTPMTTETAGITLGGGVQHNFGGSFSLASEVTGVALLGSWDINPSIMGKLGLTWAF